MICESCLCFGMPKQAHLQQWQLGISQILHHPRWNTSLTFLHVKGSCAENSIFGPSPLLNSYWFYQPLRLWSKLAASWKQEVIIN